MKNNDNLVEHTQKFFNSFIGALVGSIVLVGVVGLGLTISLKLFLG